MGIENDYVTVGELAVMAGLTTRHIERLVGAGRIQSKLLYKRRLIEKAEAKLFLDGRKADKNDG